METKLSNKKFIKEVKKLVKLAGGNVGDTTKKGHFFLNGKKYAYPTTPKNTYYALKDVKKTLKKEA